MICSVERICPGATVFRWEQSRRRRWKRACPCASLKYRKVFSARPKGQLQSQPFDKSSPGSAGVAAGRYFRRNKGIVGVRLCAGVATRNGNRAARNRSERFPQPQPRRDKIDPPRTYPGTAWTKAIPDPLSGRGRRAALL